MIDLNLGGMVSWAWFITEYARPGFKSPSSKGLFSSCSSIHFFKSDFFYWYVVLGRARAPEIKLHVVVCCVFAAGEKNRLGKYFWKSERIWNVIHQIQKMFPPFVSSLFQKSLSKKHKFWFRVTSAKRQKMGAPFFCLGFK